MFRIEIHYDSRPIQTRDLTKSQPISIGRHASNDICIDEPDVAPIHCRIAWNGASIDLAAANRDGVDVNGTLVRHASLKTGDVLRIGSADVVLREFDGEAVPEAPAAARA